MKRSKTLKKICRYLKHKNTFPLRSKFRKNSDASQLHLKNKENSQESFHFQGKNVNDQYHTKSLAS